MAAQAWTRKTRALTRRGSTRNYRKLARRSVPVKVTAVRCCTDLLYTRCHEGATSRTSCVPKSRRSRTRDAMAANGDLGGVWRDGGVWAAVTKGVAGRRSCATRARRPSPVSSTCPVRRGDRRCGRSCDVRRSRAESCAPVCVPRRPVCVHTAASDPVTRLGVVVDEEGVVRRLCQCQLIV